MLSGSDGRFILSAIGAGDQVLEVRLLGYVAFVQLVNVVAGQTLEVHVTLVAAPIPLKSIEVKGSAALRPVLEAFEHRRARGNGHFFNQAEIARMRAEADQILELILNSSVALNRRSGRLDWRELPDGSQIIRKIQPINDLSDYLAQVSHLRVARSKDGVRFTVDPDVAIGPDNGLEEYGVEDPRITFIDGEYHVTYVSVSRWGITTSLATTSDFRTFDRQGVIFLPDHKDVVIFPEKILAIVGAERVRFLTPEML